MRRRAQSINRPALRGAVLFFAGSVLAAGAYAWVFQRPVVLCLQVGLVAGSVCAAIVYEVLARLATRAKESHGTD